jgi:hypothetical protein
MVVPTLRDLLTEKLSAFWLTAPFSAMGNTPCCKENVSEVKEAGARRSIVPVVNLEKRLRF